jgi:hypothetical protein
MHKKATREDQMHPPREGSHCTKPYTQNTTRRGQTLHTKDGSTIMTSKQVRRSSAWPRRFSAIKHDDLHSSSQKQIPGPCYQEGAHMHITVPHQ